MESINFHNKYKNLINKGFTLLINNGGNTPFEMVVNLFTILDGFNFYTIKKDKEPLC